MSAATDSRTSRILLSVHPDLAAKVRVLLKQMLDDGFPMMVTDGNRTAAEQYALYLKGRRPAKDDETPQERKARLAEKIVTNADGYKKKSNHQGGRAVDCTFLDALGRPFWPEPARDPKTREIVGPWRVYGERAKALGLKWGGDFKSMKGGDCPHVELP